MFSGFERAGEFLDTAVKGSSKGPRKLAARRIFAAHRSQFRRRRRVAHELECGKISESCQ